MTDYFDHVERDLRTAVRLRRHLPWYSRIRPRVSSAPRPLIVALAALALAAPALAAITLLRSGSAVGPTVPVAPHQWNGVAIPATARLLALRAPDPAGGPAWGMRLVRTTRGVLCAQVGRSAFGAVGVLGRDGAFRDDGRFHPFSLDYETEAACVQPDARGLGFLSVAEYGVPASALSSPGGGCDPRNAGPRMPRCPASDLRDVVYGLLGPDAAAITYTAPSGRTVTVPTRGPDGAYLVVLRGRRGDPRNGSTWHDVSVLPGVLTAVHYRGGATCEVGNSTSRCRPVGFEAARVALPAQATVATALRVRVDVSRRYCTRSQFAFPCPHGTPARATALDSMPGESLLTASFRSPVPVRGARSSYLLTLRYVGRRPSNPACTGLAQTTADYRPGERVQLWVFLGGDCGGRLRGALKLVVDSGAVAPGLGLPDWSRTASRIVGRFTVRIP